jgi:hypothetical protein
MIQVTYVEPHFDEYERKDRETEFEKVDSTIGQTKIG